MMYRGNLLPTLFLGMLCALNGQQTGRFADAKRTGVSYVQQREFDRASAVFEEIWEQDQKDSLVAELLALSYLNSRERRLTPKLEQRAVRLMEQAISMGGKATFLVRHLRGGKMRWLSGGDDLNYCVGRLSFMKDRLTFVSDRCLEKDPLAFDTSASEIKRFEYLKDDTKGCIRLQIGRNTYLLAPSTELPQDGALMAEFARKYLGTGPVTTKPIVEKGANGNENGIRVRIDAGFPGGFGSCPAPPARDGQRRFREGSQAERAGEKG